MMDSDEPVQEKKSANDESTYLARLSHKEILDLAKGDGGDRSKRLIKFEDIPILISFLMLHAMFVFGPMLVDPLFLYVPIVNENIKCLGVDEKLKKTAIVLLSFADLPYLLIIINHVLRRWRPLSCLESLVNHTIHEFLPKSLIHTSLAVLPIPQIIILVFLPTTRDSRSLNKMKFLNSLIILQYVARASPIYILCKNFNKLARQDTKELVKSMKIWIPGVVNFIMYILASHALGAFWYFFSIQREIDCWISTCQSENECNLSTLQCDNTPFRNVTLLNDLCPTNPPNPMTYDFGIFVDALQSGIVGTIDFPQKLLMCFSWGLRNLSSFASNLNSSPYAWETAFVIFISISGLVLFIYLLGHLQTFMQAITRTSNIWLKIREIDRQINLMKDEYDLTKNMASAIFDLAKEALEENEDLQVENIFSLLPVELQKHLKRHLFLATLTKVPGLKNVNKEVLEAIMKHLEPVNYADGSYIIREGEPLDRMLFITQGSVLTYKTSIGGESGSSSIIRLAKREFYGEELIGWAAASTSFSDLPISAKTVKSRSKVEVFVLMADSLERVVPKFPTQSNTELPQPADSTPVEISIS